MPLGTPVTRGRFPSRAPSRPARDSAPACTMRNGFPDTGRSRPASTPPPAVGHRPRAPAQPGEHASVVHVLDVARCLGPDGGPCRGYGGGLRKVRAFRPFGRGLSRSPRPVFSSACILHRQDFIPQDGRALGPQNTPSSASFTCCLPVRPRPPAKRGVGTV